MANSNPSPDTRFKKGDPRIWRHGRPRSFDALRELALAIADEKAKSGGQPVVIDGHTATVAEMILRSWATSKNPQLQRAFIEVAYGKVPDRIEGGEIPLRVIIEYANSDTDNTD
jgi:hypothetical protein